MPPNTHDGSLEAMGHVAEWVRYADAKAGLAAAGFAGVLAILAAQAGKVTDAVQRGGWWAAVCLTLSALTVLLTIVTLYFLVDAVVPRPRNSRPTANRFAWPAVAGADAKKLQEHVEATPLHEDAWSQTKQLADIAKQKYDAVRAALVCFMFLTVFGVALVVIAGVASAISK